MDCSDAYNLHSAYGLQSGPEFVYNCFLFTSLLSTKPACIVEGFWCWSIRRS